MIPQITEINFPSYATLNSATITLSEMGDRNITTQIKIDGDIVPDFSGWELEFKGERFVLPVKEPQAAKDNTSRRSIVDLTFSSWAVQEMKRYFFVEMTSIESGTAIADKYKASLGLNIENFVTAFNNVLNYYFNGNIEMDLFGSGTGIYSAEPAFFEIDYTHIWDVLQKIYEIYQVRWTITYDSTAEKYVIKVGYPAAEIDDHEFEYGYEGGLLRFERQVQDYDITNVLLGRGGEKNLPYRYFKKVDPQNPNWAGDPDAIPELKNIYFENLRDINFRRYVQGWKTNPNRILEEGDVVETYDSARGETDFAYAKGHTDERFNPVEYVKDDASIAIYGERWGALENADDIYPTIQGIEVDPYGRIDQVVDVEPVTTDDIEAMAADAAEVTNVAGASRTEWINYNSTLELDINGADFSVPEGKVGNLTIQNTWFDTILYAKRGNDQVNVDPADAVHELVDINTTLSYVTVVNRSTGTELPPSGIPAGNYFYKLHIVVKAEFESSMYNSVNVTVGVNGMKLTTSEGSANAWKPTFDIWVKNIWNTTQQSDESDEQYAARVWEPILGDRTGEEAKVAFSTGFLSISEDYNFTIASIPVVDRTKTIDGVVSEWRITLIKSDAEYEATGKYIPNAATGGNASAGDYFFFTGIDMPWAYVLWAEEKLNAYKETELAKLKQINPTWIIRIDKVRANTKLQGELEYLADRFASGAKLRVKDKRFTNGQVLTLYVQTVTYTWQEPSSGNPYLVPDIEVVLSDKIEVSADPVTQLEGDVQNIQSTYAKISDIESAIRRVASPIFLKKTGESERSLSPTRFSSLMASESFRQGDIGGQGWGAYTDGEGHSVLEADTIVVRKDMRVNTLTVNQIAYLGGKQIISAAAMECTKVDDTDSGYVCYFDQKQGSVANLFKVDDIVLGQVWNADESEQRYYKRKVIAVSTDSITLSKDIADGDGVPQPKDIMVQYGSYSDTSRQYVIVRDVIGGGYERMLSGLTTVYANGNEYYFAGRQSGSTPRWFVGDANGQHASYQNGVLNITGRLSVTTQVDKGNGTYESLSNYLSNLQDQIDGNIQTWYATGEPTLQNYPASTWPTVEDKNNHIGDLYYESETGKAYRFMLDGNTYKWTPIADEDIAAALALAQQNQTAIAGLAYLKAATNQGTLVQGGLVLTSMIQLGQTEEGTYKVYSGINGIMDTTALGNGIAAWYGGPMADIGADSTLTDFAKSLFRFDGSGYLASGNIKWDLNGNGEIPGISWNNGRITLSPDIYLQGGDRLTAVVDAVNRMYTQFAYDSHDNIVVKPTDAFYIPTSAPEYPLAGGVALWYDYNGNYSEIPSGGIGDVYDLTLRRGSVSVGPYNLGEQAADIDLASLFSGYATESYVGNRISALNLGTASQKDWVTTIVSGGAGLPTADAIYTFVNNAVTAAQPYKGVSSTAITDGGTEMPTISGYTTRTKGDVVAYNKKEFIWEGDKWRELGDEGSYALKTVQVIAGTGLAGGGAISQDVTLSLSSATQASLALADTALQSSDLDGYVNAISQGSGNYVTGITKSGKTLTITRATLPTTIALSNVTGADDLKAIEALTGTSGLLKKTAANTWALDTNSYLVASSLKDLTLQVNGEDAGTYNPNTAATINLPITEFATSEEDDAMFTFRQVPSVAVGDVCKVTSVKGKSIVWNQLFQTYPTFAGENGITATLIDGWVVLNGTATADGRVAWLMTNASFANGVNTFISGHIYLFKMCPRNGSTNTFYGRSNNAKFQAVDAGAVYDLGEGIRFSLSNASLSVYISLYFKSGVTFDNVKFRPQVIDLTAMFGSGNEPTADQFRALYTDYYDYNTGELINNTASGVEMLDNGGNSLGTLSTPITEIVPADKPTVRLNQLAVALGNSWNRNAVTYTYSDGVITMTATATGGRSIYCDTVPGVSDHKYFFRYEMKADAAMKGGYGYAGRFAVNVWDLTTEWKTYYAIDTGRGTAAQAYVYGFFSDLSIKVYVRRVEVIDLTEMYGAGNEPTSTAEVEELIGSGYIPYTTGEDIPNCIFPVGMKSAGSVADEWSGTTATKRIGVVDLGTLTWSKQSSGSGTADGSKPFFFASLINKGNNAQTLSDKYITCDWITFSNGQDKAINTFWAIGGSYVNVRDSSYTSATDFKAAMSGVLLYYELKEPETYTVDALPDILVPFDAQGTQRRLPVDTSEEVAAPMVCDFQYGANIGDLLPTVDYKIRHGHVALADEAIKLQTAKTIWGQSFDGTANVSGALTEVTDITGTGLITMPKGKFSSSLIIPHIAPSGTLETGEVYFWSDATGIYSEMPSGSGGDVGDIYPLTVVVNGVQTVYNPAEQRQTLTLSIPTALSSLTDDATHRLVTDTQISAWNAKQAAISDLATIRSNANLGAAAYGWGNHRQAGYLTSYTETDPIFSASAAAGITSTDISAWNSKQDAISDLATIRSNASTAATAVDVQQGSGLGIDSNGHLTLDSHDAADVLALGSAAFKGYDTAVTSGSANLVTSGAVYTAVSAKYTKPSTGIPKTDLASAVQTSLGKADTALQSVAFSDLTSHPTTLAGYGITDAKIANGTITLGSNSITPLTSFTETDPTVPAWAKAANKPTYTLDEIANGTTRSLANYLPLIGGTLTGNLTGTSATFADGKFTSSLIIPHIAPSVILESEESYLYASATGNFSEEAPDAVGIASVIQTSSSSESGGTNIVTVTLTDGSKSTFGVRNGQQGNSGYSGAAGELEVVNNLTDGGATAALSAEMGKTLDGKIGALKDKNLNKRLFGTRVSGSAPWPGFVVSDYIDIPASHFTSRMYNWGARPVYGCRYVDSGGNIITLTRNTGTLFNSFVIDYYDIPASAVTIRIPLYNLTEEQIASIFIGSDSDADYLSWPFLAKGTLPAVTSAWYAGDSDEIKAIVDAYPEYKDMTGYPSVRVSSKNLFSLKDVMFYGYNTVSPGYPTYYSGYMPVEAGKKYTLSFKGTFSPQTYYYTSEKVYIERSLYATSTAPATAAFARVALTSYNDVHLLDPSSEVQFEQSEFATSYEPYFIYGTDDISVPLKDKGFAFIGDSFTAGNLWCTTMASTLKAKVVYNAAVSGSTWSTNAPDQADSLISSGSTPDYILCFLGVNDANNTIPLGNIVYSNNIAELESSTFTGGVQRTLNKLMNAFPSAVIKIGWTPAGQSFTGTLDVSQYINRLKDLSIVYGVQFIETRYCGISPYINADADYYEYGTGGGHPTATGQTRIGEAMARIMVSNQ